MTVSRERIDQAYQTMIRIVGARPDAEKFVPIIIRLEEELARKESKAATLERIRAQASQIRSTR